MCLRSGSIAAKLMALRDGATRLIANLLRAT
jgi:hypothetical protein